MKFFWIRGARYWSGHGNALLAGVLASPRRTSDRRIRLIRTGPFIPPITFPPLGTVVISSEFRKQLESTEFGPFSFRPVVKEHIVNMAWEKWDRAAADPPISPDGGTFDTMLLHLPNSREASEELGHLWEVILPRVAYVDMQRLKGSGQLGGPGNRVYRVGVDPRSWDGEAFFRGENRPTLIISDQFAKWLLNVAKPWIKLQECEVIRKEAGTVLDSKGDDRSNKDAG